VNHVTLYRNYVILSSTGILNFAAYDLVQIKKNIVMPILTILLVIIAAGVILWLVNSYIPMQRTIKNILNAVVVIILVIWLLNVFGVLESLKNVTI
jgi:hypothetical protein